MIEVTSTGLTHHVVKGRIVHYTLKRTAPDTFNTYEDRYFGLNYGVIDIEFDEKHNSYKILGLPVTFALLT